MSYANIVPFPSTPRTFKPRVEIRDVYRPDAEVMSWVVEVLDQNGHHKIGEYESTEEAEDSASYFKMLFLDKRPKTGGAA